MTVQHGVIERFWAKVDKGGACWLWTASTRNKGYGAFCYRNERGVLVQGRAHRFSYELHYGPIPVGLFVLHRCDNPSCVNPAHLALGTNQDNVTDMMAKGRHVPGGSHCGDDGQWKRGEQHHAAKLTAVQVLEMRGLYAAGGWSYAKLGKRFGVNTSCAYKVVNRLLWRSL